MSELQRLAEHCETQATRLEQARPRVLADVAAGALPAEQLARRDRDHQLWRQLAGEIRTHLDRGTTTDPTDLEEPLWETP